MHSRLTLHLWRENDAEEAFALVQQSRIHLEHWVEWVLQVNTADDLRKLIQYSIERHHAGVTWQYCIRQDGRIVGGVGLVRRSDADGEIGYWLGAAHCGQGIATQCAREVVRFALNAIHLDSIEIRSAVANKRSRAVAERLGFIRTAILPGAHWAASEPQDSVVYRLNRRSARLKGWIVQ